MARFERAMRPTDNLAPDGVTQYLWASAVLKYRPTEGATRVRDQDRGLPLAVRGTPIALTLWRTPPWVPPPFAVMDRFDELELSRMSSIHRIYRSGSGQRQ